VTESEEIKCACGCNEVIEKPRKNQRFLDHRHKDNWHNKKKTEVLAAIRGLSDGDIKKVVEYTKKLKGNRNGISK